MFFLEKKSFILRFLPPCQDDFNNVRATTPPAWNGVEWSCMYRNPDDKLVETVIWRLDLSDPATQAWHADINSRTFSDSPVMQCAKMPTGEYKRIDSWEMVTLRPLGDEEAALLYARRGGKVSTE